MEPFCNGFTEALGLRGEKASEQNSTGKESDIVRLNVGGEVYVTTRATLTRYPDSMLGAMFSGQLPTARDCNGCFFIDRDGTTFRHVLNFLRCGQVILPTDFTQLDLFAAEADFYRLEPLISAIAHLKSARIEDGSYLEIIEVRIGPTATMPTNNSRDKTVLSCRRDVVSSLPSHFFTPRFQQNSSGLITSSVSPRDECSGNVEQDKSFVELELFGSNVRLRLGEHLKHSGWILCHSDMSSSSCHDTGSYVSQGLMIEHSYRDRWYYAGPMIIVNSTVTDRR